MSTTWHDDLKTSAVGPISLGLLSILVGLGGFGAWAALAPLEGAVAAFGTVVAPGMNKAVQPLEGGIVASLLISEGDVVITGQPLVRLESSSAEAAQARLKIQISGLEAEEARSLAERDGLPAINFPEKLTALDVGPDIEKIVKDQSSQFDVRIRQLKVETSIIHQEIAALQEQATGLSIQLKAAQDQRALAQEELADVEKLLENELVAKGRALQLRRGVAELDGSIGQITAAIASAAVQIAQKQQEIQKLNEKRIADANEQIPAIRAKLSDLEQQLRVANVALTERVINAPATGRIANLAVAGPGAVVGAGQVMMEIVPSTAKPVVEVHVRVQDIDQVKIGTPARLTFAAFDPRRVPSVDGTVYYVSADRVSDTHTGEVYYVARISISDVLPTTLKPSDIGPGQPVDAFITTGSRTFFEYLADPFMAVIERAARE